MASSASRSPSHGTAGGRRTSLLTLGALGVVYGDIGTSPLYTLQAVIAATGHPAPTPATVTGAISCIIWALFLVVTVKYVWVVMRADNEGEGGVLALASLAARRWGHPRFKVSGLLLLGAIGAALFYGDAVITPAISVLGAVEGLKVAAPHVAHLAVPISLGVIVALFLIQRLGSGRVGVLFGPVMLLWFLVLAATGVAHIGNAPQILAALNPAHALAFLLDAHWLALAIIGGVALAITGAEALYADMGHFGARPIRLAWLGLVFPALVLNYLGQGGLLLSTPAAIDNPFFHLFSPGWVPAMLVLATVAAVIASQAVISGAYSMTHQAMQLGLLPRLSFRFTSAREIGQIYVPAVNMLLFVGVVLIVIGFGSSAALSNAYGIAVTLTMLVTTVLIYCLVASDKGRARRWKLLALAPLVLLDMLLVAGCATKLLDGGWMSLAIAAVLGLLLITWAQGRARVLRLSAAQGIGMEQLLQDPGLNDLHRTPRLAMFLVSDPSLVPIALLHNVKHNQVLHEHNMLVHVNVHRVPWVEAHSRVQVQPLPHGFWVLTLHFGFMDVVDVPAALQGIEVPGVVLDPAQTSWFLSRPILVKSPLRSGLGWRTGLFIWMSHQASRTATHFHIPEDALIELNSHLAF